MTRLFHGDTKTKFPGAVTTCKETQSPGFVFGASVILVLPARVVGGPVDPSPFVLRTTPSMGFSCAFET